MRRACLFVGLLASAGCSKILGLSDVTRSDAGGGSGDASIDAPPNTVIGRSYFRYQLTSGVTEVPRDLSALSIQALIPDAGQPSGYMVVTGSGKPDGTFSISPVPDGVEYLLKIGSAYYVTSQHVVDQHFDTPYRGSPAPATLTGPAYYDFNLTGLSRAVYGPEGIYDDIELDSWSLAYQGFSQSAPANNAQTLTLSFDWATGFPIATGAIPLPDQAQGDDVHLLHYRNQEIVHPTTKRRHTTRWLVSAFDLTNVTLTPGAHNAQAGAAMAVNSTNSVPLSIQRGLFDSMYDNTTTQEGLLGNPMLWVSIYAHPLVNDFNIGSSLIDVYFDDWSRSTSLTESHTVAFGDPFPTSWARMLTLRYNRYRWLLVPGTTVSRFNGFGAYTRTFVYPGGTPTLTPSLNPPGNVRIANQSSTAGGKITFDGTAPVNVTWNAVGSAKLYQVSVIRVYANGAQTRTQVMGSLMTTKTSIDIPAEVFSGSEFFAINVAAIQTPADYANGELSPNGVPNQVATFPGAMFRYGTMCGNGTIEGTEQCDAMGESATCDVDCTTRICGDGLRNATAGEACDTIKDSVMCDADCTVAACGDGHVNLSAGEDCDDGNQTADGNGCSATCKFNNFCGNGTVEAVVEQCDPGAGTPDTVNCDSDCTLAQCGDGHHNTAANEMCDDGNQDETDGCKSNCMP